MQLHEFTLNHICGHTSKQKFDIDDDDFPVDIAEEEDQICPNCMNEIEIKAADKAWEEHCEKLPAERVVSLPCIFGQHVYVDTGTITKIWSDNKTDSEPPPDCQTITEQKCLLCGQTRSS